MLLIRAAATWFAVGMLLLGVMPAMASAELTLAQLVVAAGARNPGAELSAAERDLAAALHRKSAQPFAGPPSVNLKYQTDVVGSALGYREWEGGIALPLWTPGQAASFSREAEGVAASATALDALRRLTLAGEVRERWWAVNIARSEAGQAESARMLARALREDVRRRVAAGELPRSDLLLAGQELLLRDEAALSAASREAEAVQLFVRYTGLQPPAKLPAELPGAPRELSDTHPELQLALRRAEQARRHRDRVLREGIDGPTLWLGGKSVRAGSGVGYESAVGVEVSMPFGKPAHHAPAAAEAAASLVTAQVELARVRLTLQESLTRAALDVDRLAAMLGQTERRRTLAEQALDLGRQAFDLGEIDLVRLLQTQGHALDARHDYLLRRLEHARAVARLNQALGVIPQ